jgi:sugar lactone lactonase YvrE
MARAVLLTIALVLLTSASARANGEIFTLAGAGTPGPPQDGTPAILAGLPQQTPVAALPDGGFLVAEETRVWRVDPQGLIHLMAGNGREGNTGDGGPAIKAEVWAGDVEALPGGGFLVSVTGNRIRMVDPSGAITTVAGGGKLTGENVPAAQADLGSVNGLAALPGGGFVFGDESRRVRMVGPDGRIRTIAGTGEYAGDARAPRGEPAASAAIDFVDFSLAPDGSVLLADAINGCIERVTPDGKLTLAAKAPKGQFPSAVAALPDGGIAYATITSVTERIHIWRVSPDGTSTILAGAGPFARTAPDGLQQRLSGKSPLRADLHYLYDLDTTPDGGLLISHSRADAFGEGGFVDYVAPAVPTVLGAATCATATACSRPAACSPSPSR